MLQVIQDLPPSLKHLLELKVIQDPLLLELQQGAVDVVSVRCSTWKAEAEVFGFEVLVDGFNTWVTLIPASRSHKFRSTFTFYLHLFSAIYESLEKYVREA